MYVFVNRGMFNRNQSSAAAYSFISQRYLFFFSAAAVDQSKILTITNSNSMFPLSLMRQTSGLTEYLLILEPFIKLKSTVVYEL
jgi:hypothetical protein